MKIKVKIRNEFECIVNVFHGGIKEEKKRGILIGRAIKGLYSGRNFIKIIGEIPLEDLHIETETGEVLKARGEGFDYNIIATDIRQTN